jgi:Tat protein secretion system quality control protein TatD with DNase activity
MEYLLDQDEVNRLIHESNAPYVDVPTTEKQNYPTYTREEVQAIMNDDYDPTKFSKKR